MSEGRICFILNPRPVTIDTRARKFIGKAELHFASVTTDDEHKTRCDRQLGGCGLAGSAVVVTSHCGPQLGKYWHSGVTHHGA